MLGFFCRAVAFLFFVVMHIPSAAQERTKLYLGASSKTLGYSPLWVGSKRGFFEQQGLDVQLILLRGVPMTGTANVGSRNRARRETRNTRLETVAFAALPSTSLFQESPVGDLLFGSIFLHLEKLLGQAHLGSQTVFIDAAVFVERF